MARRKGAVPKKGRTPPQILVLVHGWQPPLLLLLFSMPELVMKLMKFCIMILLEIQNHFKPALERNKIQEYKGFEKYVA